LYYFFFFFKQKTAYDISRDWSSDVCSSDLIKEVCNLLGGFVKLGDDSIIIQGKAKLKGDATIASYNDHRIVMATAILATITENPVIIKNIEVVNKSYPNFFKDLARLGARFEVV